MEINVTLAYRKSWNAGDVDVSVNVTATMVAALMLDSGNSLYCFGRGNQTEAIEYEM